MICVKFILVVVALITICIEYGCVGIYIYGIIREDAVSDTDQKIVDRVFWISIICGLLCCVIALLA